MDDLGTILDKMRRREELGCKSALKLHVLQGRSAAVIKKVCPKTWKDELHEATGLKKSTWYDRVNAYQEFGALLLDPNNDADEGIDIVPEYASVPCGSLRLIHRVCAGVTDEIKHEWLGIAASTSVSDLKKLVAEKEGKEVCECYRWKPETIEVCQDCGKRKPKSAQEDPVEPGSEGRENQG